ncbi:MAG: hypothetical protein JKX82_07305, partial [Oleispira sp.]|nr:hypothetical protein [Oleispira sp.]
MSVDKDGAVISRYGSDIWDFKVFGATKVMHFKDYDDANKALFKQVMFYLIYSHLFPGKYDSLRSVYKTLQKLFETCSQHKIRADELRRFPKVIEQVAKSQAKSSFGSSVWHFHRILKNEAHIGFQLLDAKSIAHYSRFNPEYELGQNAYIPPAIWNTFIHRLDEVPDDFIENQEKIEKAYHWIAATTIENQRNVRGKANESSPFNVKTPEYLTTYGSFEMFLKDYELYDWVAKYQEHNKKLKGFTVRQFSSALNNTVITCYMCVLFYSLMRMSEAKSLRVDCLIIEKDERLGNFYMLVGETTKTDPDCDDRWVVNKRVQKATEVAKTLIEWKLSHLELTDSNAAPHLFQRADVWVEAQQKSQAREFSNFAWIMHMNQRFFGLENYRIT